MAVALLPTVFGERSEKEQSPVVVKICLLGQVAMYNIKESSPPLHNNNTCSCSIQY